MMNEQELNKEIITDTTVEIQNDFNFKKYAWKQFKKNKSSYFDNAYSYWTQAGIISAWLKRKIVEYIRAYHSLSLSYCSYFYVCFNHCVHKRSNTTN